MGVYIPNMEKPKGCRWCPLNHDSMCYVIQPYKTDKTNGEQCRNDCPLIEIPIPHGRLIDGDELVKHLRKDPLFDLVERYGISGVIESRPTILDKERE